MKDRGFYGKTKIQKNCHKSDDTHAPFSARIVGISQRLS